MERVETALAGHAVIGINSSIFMYLVEDAEGRAHAAGTILRLIAGLSGVTSTLTLTEAVDSYEHMFYSLTGEALRREAVSLKITI